MRLRILLILVLFNGGLANAQSKPEQLAEVLGKRLQTPTEVTFQLREYLMGRVARLNVPTDAAQWTAEENRLRKHLLEDVVFHGWPREWVNSPPKFEDLGLVPGGVGYRMRKLRYEIVPGFQSTAILYEPLNVQGKIPAILNVNGHELPLGKAVEYKQKRCINFARRGIMALSLEWLECGELFHPEDRRYGDPHWGGAYLDFVGANSVGLFYLAMRRGLDYLYEHPNVDSSRLGVTGLSGGGWQTITLSALDERVAVAVPVAGYASMVSDIERFSDMGDMEQISTDFYAGVDNAHLTAMRAPRPTLLIFDAEDDCCFRAPLVKPYVYDQVLPIFKLYGKADAFEWHENEDPGTHNYQLDNRLRAYRFFAKHFHLPPIENEIPVDAEIKSYDELAVGLPKDNLTFLELAKKLGGEVNRPPMPPTALSATDWAASERKKLQTVVRYNPTNVKHPWALANTKGKGVETRSYRFELSNGLSAVGVWAKAITTSDAAPVTVVLNDKGKKSAAAEISDRVNRGEQVLAIDLLFVGDSSPDEPNMAELPECMVQTLSTMGDRALGMEVAQLMALTRWLQQTSRAQSLRLECTGIRSQVVALIAAALEPTLFSEVQIHQGMRSLNYVLEAPIRHRDAPDLFCLDLYKEFDVDRLVALAQPAKITLEKVLEVAQTGRGVAAINARVP
jgi:dienelactone hydrolase